MTSPMLGSQLHTLISVRLSVVDCPHEAKDTERMAVTAMVAILLIRCPITRMVTSVLGGALKR